jgi:hypothetical protein
LLKLSSKNIVIQTREQSSNAYFGVRYNRKEDNYEGWNIYGKILDMIKQEMEIKESIKVNAESFTEFNNKGMVTINYAKKTLNSNDRVLLLSSINVEQSSDILNENDLIDPNVVYITLTDISRDLIQTYKLELTNEQQEIVNELVELDKVTNEDRDNLRIQELSKIIESFFVESNLVNKKQNIDNQEIIPFVPLTSMSDITNHSGGAKFSDTKWDQIGREFGVINHNHYREPLSYIDTTGKSAKGSKTLDSLELQKANITPTYITQENYNEGAIKSY